MWSAPAVILASAAPAYAASGNVLTGVICQLYYGCGSVSQQDHTVSLGVTSSEGVIPAGSVFTWTFSVTGGGAGTSGVNRVPNVNRVRNGAWTLTVSPSSGRVCASFTATLRFHRDYIGKNFCEAQLVWSGSCTLRPGATITASSTGTVPQGQGTVEPASLEWTVARRDPTNTRDCRPVPHCYLRVSGQCYPVIRWSCMSSRNGYDNVARYPGGFAVTAPRWDGSHWVTPTRCQ